MDRFKEILAATCNVNCQSCFQIQIQIQKKVYCHKYIDIHNIHKQIYSNNEGNEADAYLPLYFVTYSRVTGVNIPFVSFPALS